MKNNELQNLLSATLQMRLNGEIEESFKLCQKMLSGQNQFSEILWQHQPVFWSTITAGICILTRRHSEDAGFVQKLWSDQSFIHSFHRHASELPPSLESLQNILQNEYAALIDQSHALHWIIRDKHHSPWGILSLTDISLPSKKAEVLIGVLPNAPVGLSTAAMLILFQFYFKVMKFNKLYTLIYEDNPQSLKSTLHLGFQIEGHLRQEIIDPDSGQLVDLIRTGLLAEEAFTPSNLKLMKKLLS